MPALDTDQHVHVEIPADELVMGPKAIPTMQQPNAQQQYQLGNLVSTINNKKKALNLNNRQSTAVDYITYLRRQQERSLLNKVADADRLLGRDTSFYANDKLSIK